MGIRQKIMLGFAALAVLLFFSGFVSYLEWKRLSAASQNMLEASYQNMQLSKSLLDAVQDQNTALVQIVVTGNNEYQAQLQAGRAAFDETIKEARVAIRDLPVLDSIYAISMRYNELINVNLDKEAGHENIDWFIELYGTIYTELTTSIKDFMISSQRSLDIKAKQLENNAYRAIMPGIIALAIAIVIIIVFFYFMDIYYIRPVLKIGKGVDNYLKHKMPFKVTFEGKDEVHHLKEGIEDIIMQCKTKKNE